MKSHTDPGAGGGTYRRHTITAELSVGMLTLAFASVIIKLLEVISKRVASPVRMEVC